MISPALEGVGWRRQRAATKPHSFEKHVLDLPSIAVIDNAVHDTFTRARPICRHKSLETKTYPRGHANLPTPDRSAGEREHGERETRLVSFHPPGVPPVSFVKKRQNGTERTISEEPDRDRE